MTTISIFCANPAFLVPRHINITFPACWNDCSKAELMLISSLLLAHNPNVTQRLRQSQVFLGILTIRLKQAMQQQHRRWPQWLINIAVRRTIRRASIHDMGVASTDTLPWLTAGNTLTRQPFPQGLLKAYPAAPADNFNDITVGQYEDGMVFFGAFIATKEVKHLYMLAKVLYSVPPDKYNDTPKLPDPGPFQAVEVPALFLVYQWFAACHEATATGSKAFSKSGSSKTTFTHLIHANAGPELGTIQQVRRLLLKAFLFHIQQAPEPTATHK